MPCTCIHPAQPLLGPGLLNIPSSQRLTISPEHSSTAWLQPPPHPHPAKRLAVLCEGSAREDCPLTKKAMDESEWLSPATPPRLLLRSHSVALWLARPVAGHLALCSIQASGDLWLLLISVWGCTCPSTCALVKGQLGGAGSLFHLFVGSRD